MFDRPRKKNQDPAHVHGLTTIVTASQLLHQHKRAEQIELLRKACQFQPEQFNHFCENLIYQLLNYMQQLPDTTNSYFSSPGGAFDHALSRTSAASDLFSNLVLNNPEHPLSEAQQRWWYALFSAGLLRDISKLHLDYHIQLYHQHGHLIKTWHVLLDGPLTAMAHAYQFDTINRPCNESYRQRLNIVLAQQLMPKQGLAYLAAQDDVFEVWLALLHEDAATAGTLALILDRADDLAIQDNLIQLPLDLHHPKQSGGRVNTFIDHAEDGLSREQQMGIEFLQWLITSLALRKLTFNQHPLLSVPGGTLIGPDTFKLFVRESALFKNWLAVKQAVMSLDIHDKTAKLADEHSVVLRGSIGLPNQFQHQINQQTEPCETNAIDARHPNVRQQLSEKGQWQTLEAQANATLQLKSSTRG